jgi:hypothetical protein
MSVTMCPIIAFVTFISPSLEFASPSAFKPQHWRPPFVSLKEHLQNVTQKGTWEGSFDRRLIPSDRRASPLHRSNNRPNHTHTPNSPPATICRVPCSNHRSQQTQGPSGTTNSLSRGAHNEHLSSKHYASIPTSTPNHQNPRGPAIRL